MTKQGPLLSICIPTYNREKYLKELLDSIVKQKEFISTNEVEIVIDDGPSTDNTELIVKEYIKIYWNKIKYYRNSKRIWMCPAFLEAFSLWKWEYCWIFSSDDLMTQNTLKITLDLIKQHSPCLIFWREIVKWNESNDNKVLDIKILNWINDFSLYVSNCKKDLFIKNTDIFTFISLFCSKKDFFEKNIKILSNSINIEEIKQNYFNFSLIWFTEIMSNDIIAIIEHPIFVLYTPNNDSWRPNIKILKDLKLLINTINKNYNLSPNFKYFLNKMYFTWIKAFIIDRGIIPYIKRIWLYSPLKYVYHKIH